MAFSTIVLIARWRRDTESVFSGVIIQTGICPFVFLELLQSELLHIVHSTWNPFYLAKRKWCKASYFFMLMTSQCYIYLMFALSKVNLSMVHLMDSRTLRWLVNRKKASKDGNYITWTLKKIFIYQSQTFKYLYIFLNSDWIFDQDQGLFWWPLVPLDPLVPN